MIRMKYKFVAQMARYQQKLKFIDGMYGYATKVLDQDVHVSSERFGDLSVDADFVPVGQSLWCTFLTSGDGLCSD